MALAPETDPELIRRLAKPRLSVRGRDRSWPLYVGYGAVILIAIFVFMSLSRARVARPKAIAVAPTVPSLMPLTIPPPMPTIAAPIPQPPPIIAPAPVVPLPPAGLADPATRLRAPAVIVDLAAKGDGPEAPAAATAQAAKPPEGGGTTATSPGAKLAAEDQRFAANVAASRPETVTASHLTSTSSIAPQGTIVPAVLESALNSSLPGYVRAVVSRDVRGFDGSLVLIPRGTRLIGEYKSGVANGVSRAFVVWSRLLTPDGVSVDIGSPAVDTLGRGGIAGEANSHFLRRFGGAILLSVLDAGLQAGVNHFSPNNSSTVVIGSSQQANNAATVALQRDIDIPTTITVPQGTPIRVFVARDLDFAGALPAQPK